MLIRASLAWSGLARRTTEREYVAVSLAESAAVVPASCASWQKGAVQQQTEDVHNALITLRRLSSLCSKSGKYFRDIHLVVRGGGFADKPSNHVVHDQLYIW